MEGIVLDLQADQVKLKNDEGPKFKAEKHRIKQHVAFALSIIGSGYAGMNFSTTASIIAKVYGTNEITINNLGAMFPLISAISNIPSVFLIEKIGVKRTIQLAAFLQIIGCWLRVIFLKSTGNFDYVFLG